MMDRIADLYYTRVPELIGWRATLLLPWLGAGISTVMLAIGICGLRETYRQYKNQERE